jgi:hypothetical protein
MRLVNIGMDVALRMARVFQPIKSRLRDLSNFQRGRVMQLANIVMEVALIKVKEFQRIK